MSILNEKHEHQGTVIKRAGARHHDDEHGGAWKVAFADFCLALLALFLVLWLMASREKESLERAQRDSGAGQLESPGQRPDMARGPDGSLIERFPGPHAGSAGGKEGAPAQQVSYDSPEELTALSRALKKMSADAGLASNLAAVVTPSGLRVMLHDTEEQGMFMRGSSLPTGPFARLLRKMGPLFAHMENQMLVVGHTDSVKYVGVDRGGVSNWTLSSGRAMAARAELLAGGMRPQTVLQVVGMADSAPLDAKKTEADVNRRIELLILTRAQSRAVVAMFGAPETSERLSDGVSISTPGGSDLKALRNQLAK
jgi:chemotaxis protein MotB